MVTNVMATRLNFYENIEEDRHAAYTYACKNMAQLMT